MNAEIEIFVIESGEIEEVGIRESCRNVKRFLRMLIFSRLFLCEGR